MVPAAAARAIPFRSPREVEAATALGGTGVLAHLSRHGLLAYPSETVYGFGGAADRDGVDALQELKGRSGLKPFLLLVDGIPMIEKLGLRLEGPAAVLAARHWPGALTLVLPTGRTGRSIPDPLQGPTGGVAVRWTAHAGMARLITAYGRPITSTSANRPGVPPAMSAQEILSEWGDAMSRGVLVVLDGGRLEPSAPSTVIDCTEHPIRVLRAGAIPIQELRASVPDLLGDT